LKEAPEDNFMFEYYRWRDLGLENHRLPEVISADIRELKKIKMKGLLNCQTLRCFYPTGLAMEVLARTLWNHRLGYKQIAENYYAQTFGKSSGWVQDYFAQLDNLLPEKYFHHDSFPRNKDEKLIKKKIALLKGEQPQIEKQRDCAKGIPRLCLENLSHYNKIAAVLEEAGLKSLEGKKKEAISLLKKAENFLLASEEKIEDFLDTYLVSGEINYWINYCLRH